jgi:hypothetical protein
LHVVQIGNSTYQLRAKSTDKLGNEHVDAYGSCVRAARHHVVNYGGHRPVIPRHEEGGQGEATENEGLLVGLNGKKKERSGEKKGHGDGDDSSVGEATLQTVGNEPAE